MTGQFTYAAITPARNESSNLQRLAACMIAQRSRAVRWLVVDNGSTDDTVAVVRKLSAEHPWVSLLETPGEQHPTRGAPVVRAFHAGLEWLSEPVDVIVKLDADVSFEPDYFEKQMAAFQMDARLGISSGVCLEPDQGGNWMAARVTRGHVRGAVRAYRSRCLSDVLPLVEGMGWDGVDELNAQVHGWTTRTETDLSFHHHRALGAREDAWRRWFRQGRMAHFMDYRISYLIARTVYNATHEPSAIAMLGGYSVAAATRQPKCAATAATALLREQQSLGALPTRVREKLGIGS